MKIAINGTRGSVPSTDPLTSRYGGNTSCFTVEEDGHMLILDGGTGIQKVKIDPVATRRIDILLSHLHLDHIQGLGFYKPLYMEDLEVHIWGPASVTENLHARLSRYLSPPLFPVRLRDLPCKLELHEIGNSEFAIGHFLVKSRYVIHSGPTVGYRVEGHNSTLAYIPDHEPALGPRGMIADPKWISGFDLANQVDLLLHDGHYTSEEYLRKKGWGHSSMEDALLFARIAQAKNVLLTHHDPDRTDKQLDELFVALSKAVDGSVSFAFAREGLEIVL
jgi:phosphoribosyl 1,2-cyclic phosphodiesterase